VEIGTFSSLIAEGRTCQLYYLNNELLEIKIGMKIFLPKFFSLTKFVKIDGFTIPKAGANSKIKIKFVMLIIL
jgi:hypothetical protein